MSSALPASPALCKIAHSRAHGDLDDAKQGGHEWPGWGTSLESDLWPEYFQASQILGTPATPLQAPSLLTPAP